MKVLFIAPGKKPITKEIDGSLESLQSEVGGYIEPIYLPDDSAVILVDEDGIRKGLPSNRIIIDGHTGRQLMIVGNIIIVGRDKEDFASLSEQLIEKYVEMFSGSTVTIHS